MKGRETYMTTVAPQRARTEGAMGRLARRRHGFGSIAGVALALGIVATAAACSSGPSINQATVKPQVTAAYKTFFNLGNPNLDAKVAVIQDGASLRNTVNTALTSSLAKSATGASIMSATLASDAVCTKAKVPTPCAKVVYSILGQGGMSLLGNETGYAVYVNNKWLVSKSTVCTLMGLFYEATGASGAPAGCG
jgi:hypothetical protein